MLINFDDLTADAGIWIFFSDSNLTESNISVMSEALNYFLNTWESHGNPIKGGFTFLDGYFLVVGAQDTQNVSGCGKDKLFGVIKSLEVKIQKNFTNKMWVAYKTPHTPIKTTPISTFKQCIRAGDIPHETVIFHTGAIEKHELSNFAIPLKESWVKGMLPH